MTTETDMHAHLTSSMVHVVTTKRPDGFEGIPRQAGGQAGGFAAVFAQRPDLPSLSHEEYTYVEGAREALATMKRTFEFWMVIARGL